VTHTANIDEFKHRIVQCGQSRTTDLSIISLQPSNSGDLVSMSVTRAKKLRGGYFEHNLH